MSRRPILPWLHCTRCGSCERSSLRTYVTGTGCFAVRRLRLRPRLLAADVARFRLAVHRLERRCVSTHTNAHATCRAKRVDLSGAASASLNSLPLAAVCVSFALVSASVPHAVSAASTANSAPTARRVVARRKSGRICRASHAEVHSSCAGGYVSAAHRARRAVVRQAMLGHQPASRSEEHTSELPSLMRSSYAVLCL